MVRDLGVGLSLTDVEARSLFDAGPSCRHPLRVPVRSGEQVLGFAAFCLPTGVGPAGGWRLLLPVGLAALVLWAASASIAHRIARPLLQLVWVTNEIGSGKLSRRSSLDKHQFGEIGELAQSIDTMAKRIERQLADQRELLAAVSHELRSPLSRVRVLLEIARERGNTPGTLDEIERELVEIDELVGQLLASSRLDFATMNPQSLDAREIGERALVRAGLDPKRLEAEGSFEIRADATLLGRALANLLDNAKTHGGGVVSLRIRDEPDRCVFSVTDAGPGFEDTDLQHVFESFVRGKRRGGSTLGLGLSLVRRIAEAHGGSAFAENLPGGGARVSFSIARLGPGVRTAFDS